MDRPTRRRFGLWSRMALACVLSLALVATIVGVGLLLVGIPAALLLSSAVDSFAIVVPDPAAVVVAVALVGGLLVYTECAVRAVRNVPSIDDLDPATVSVVTLATYGLGLASLVVAYWAVSALADRLPAALVALIVLFGLFYLLVAGYVWAARDWSPDEESADEVEFDRTVVVVLGVAYVALMSDLPTAGTLLVLAAVAIAYVHAGELAAAVRARLGTREPSERADGPERYRGVSDELRQLVAALERVTGTAPVALGAALLVVSGAVYAATIALPTDTVVTGLAGASALGIVGLHLGGIVRAERDGDLAVLRDLGRYVDADDDWVDDDPADLRAIVTRLAGQADVPSPEVRLVEDRTPTALTVGYRPSSSTIVVSRGLVDRLEGRELEAVLAHELAHVANRDAAVMTALATPSAVAAGVADRYGMNPVVIVPAAITYAVGRWTVAVVARTREYVADDGAAAITGDPAALASALEVLDRDLASRPSSDLREAGTVEAFAIVPPPWEEHRFFDRTRRFVARTLLGTHPRTEKRIDRLRSRATA